MIHEYLPDPLSKPVKEVENLAHPFVLGAFALVGEVGGLLVGQLDKAAANHETKQAEKAKKKEEEKKDA